MADQEISNNQREFRCKHCDGKILVPKDLPPTTGPCPHCGGLITSGVEEIPVLPIPAAQIPQLPTVLTVPGVPPEPPAKAPPPPPVRSEWKPTVELPPREDHADLNQPKRNPAPKKAPPQSSGLISAMLVLLALVLLGGGVVWFAAKELGRNIEPPTSKITPGDPALNEAKYIHSGWQKDAYQVLRGYLGAATTKDKSPFILNAGVVEPKIAEFYRDGGHNDSNTPADAYAIYELSEEDRKRGLFMMIYDQPPQFDIKEFFRPLASLEVQYGVDEADLLLSTLARAGNFAMEPLRVHAFFKRTPEGLKLDWEIFAQTKYRTLRNFVERPEVGQTGVFRILIVEDVPDKGRAVAGTRTYRIVDPANSGDNARINVKVDSETGRALSSLNWRGTKENRPLTRTATVEVKWSGPATAPELEISRLVCWEFLGLGGQETPATASTQ
ncbi:MAG: hypothetical protein V4819_08760 [Verrucomicrobiota bacterium]